jgi:hypothetical protein
MKITKYLLVGLTWGLLSAATLGLGACKKDDDSHNHGDETELLTTLTLTYTSTSIATDVVKATYKDADGAGGAAPTIDVIRLKPNTTYRVTVQVADDSKSPSEDKTPEILAEGAEHQFFFAPTGSSLTFVSYDDKDTRNLPIGLLHTQRTGAAGMGKLNVKLKHQPNVKTATSTVNTGETDIDVNFDVNIN